MMAWQAQRSPAHTCCPAAPIRSLARTDSCRRSYSKYNFSHWFDTTVPALWLDPFFRRPETCCPATTCRVIDRTFAAECLCCSGRTMRLPTARQPILLHFAPAAHWSHGHAPLCLPWTRRFPFSPTCQILTRSHLIESLPVLQFHAHARLSFASRVVHADISNSIDAQEPTSSSVIPGSPGSAVSPTFPYPSFLTAHYTSAPNHLHAQPAVKPQAFFQHAGVNTPNSSRLVPFFPCQPSNLLPIAKRS